MPERRGKKKIIKLKPGSKLSQTPQSSAIRLTHVATALSIPSLSCQAAELSEIINSELENLNVICSQYQEAIVYSNLRKPEEVTEFMVHRWKDELANRRQYLSYLQSLFEDVSKCGRKIGALRDSYLSELDDLASLVGGRNSVPKEHVYPKFDKIAQLWNDLGNELDVVECREFTLENLYKFRSSFTATLTSDSKILSLTKETETLSTEEEADAARAAVEVAQAVAQVPAEAKEEEKKIEEVTAKGARKQYLLTRFYALLASLL